MRKILLLLLVACLQVGSGLARDKTVTLSFPANCFKMDTDNGLTRVQAPGLVHSYDTDTLMPMLPKIAVHVLLGPAEEVLSTSHSMSDPIILSHVAMEACQLPVPTDTEYALTVRQAQSSAFPSVTYMGTDEVRGYHMAGFEVCPFSYNAATEMLSLSENIVLTLNLGQAPSHGAGVQPTSPNAWACDTAQQWLGDMVVNASDVDTLYTDINIDILPANERYQYLIITNNALKPQFQRLADWKDIKGVRTKVMTVEEISQQYPGLSPQKQVKSAIIAMRDSTRGALRYVLLGGDETVVPVQYCRVQCIGSNNTLYVADTPADIYYASLKELDWDKNGNGLHGELEDSVSLTCDLGVTRMAVSTQTDAATQLNRVLAYEQHPDLRPYSGKMLMAGNRISSLVYDDTLGDTISDAQSNAENTYSSFIEGNWNGQRVRFFDTGTDFPEGADYDFTAANLQTQLSKGYTFAHIETHGNPFALAMENRPSYNRSDASSLCNEGYTLWLTTACNTNQFDTTEVCLAEAFMNNPTSGIIAYFGDSRLGWSGPSNQYNGMILQIILKRRYHIGHALEFVKNWHEYFARQRYDSNRWVQLSLNAMGDAEMPVYTGQPKRFSNMIFHYNNGNLLVNEHIDSCQTCVMSIDDMGESYYCVKNNVTNVWNQFSGLNDTSAYSICVTRPNYVPFVAQLHNNYCLQDEIIDSDEERYVIARHASIGHLVTEDKPSGDVTISGKLTIQCQDGVLIDSGTTIDRGSQFEIKLNH